VVTNSKVYILIWVVVFMKHIGHYTKDAWDFDDSIRRNSGKYLEKVWEGMKKHKWLEAGCVATCAFGDGVATYVTGDNFLGYAGGVTLGGVYGMGHVYIDAVKNQVKAKVGDILRSAGTAEFGCALSATLVPLFISTSLGIDFDPSVIADIVKLELISYPLAVPIGLGVMSALSLRPKNEAGRLVAQKGAIYDIADNLGRDYKVTDNRDQKRRKPMITIHGRNSILEIREEPLPEYHQKDFDRKKEALYKVFASAARISDDARNSAAGLACDVFKEIGLGNHVHVEDPFSHDHANHANQ